MLKQFELLLGYYEENLSKVLVEKLLSQTMGDTRLLSTRNINFTCMLKASWDLCARVEEVWVKIVQNKYFEGVY